MMMKLIITVEVCRKMWVLMLLMMMQVTSSVVFPQQGGPPPQVTSSHFLPARRITCDPEQHGIEGKLFSISLYKSSLTSKPILKVTDEGNGTKLVHKDNLTNPILLVHYPTSLRIDVFILQCPCVLSSAYPQCLNARELNFTCEYLYTTGGISPFIERTTANVSDVNMTSAVCCRSEPCVGDENIRMPSDSPVNKNEINSPPSCDGSSDHASTVLVVVVCLLVLALVAAVFVIIYLRRKCRRLETEGRVASSSLLSGKEEKNVSDTDQEEC